MLVEHFVEKIIFACHMVSDLLPLVQVGVLSRFMSATPGLELGDQRDLLMANVLECSSLGSSQCLDSLVCEFSREASR